MEELVEMKELVASGGWMESLFQDQDCFSNYQTNFLPRGKSS